MPKVLIQQVPDEVYCALRSLAAADGISIEETARSILSRAVLPAERVRMGDEIQTLVRKTGAHLTGDEFKRD